MRANGTHLIEQIESVTLNQVRIQGKVWVAVVSALMEKGAYPRIPREFDESEVQAMCDHVQQAFEASQRWDSLVAAAQSVGKTPEDIFTWMAHLRSIPRLMPFDLDKARNGAKIVTRDGKPVKFVAYEKELPSPIILLLDGCIVYHPEDSGDLFIEEKT